MPVIPTRFAVDFGEVFPLGAFVLGVEPAMAFSDNPAAPKLQERDKETSRLVWTVRALDANEEAARFGAEFKVKVAADHQPVPPAKANGFSYAAVEFENMTITPYANNKVRIAHSFRASGMRAPTSGRKASTSEQKTAA